MARSRRLEDCAHRVVGGNSPHLLVLMFVFVRDFAQREVVDGRRTESEVE